MSVYCVFIELEKRFLVVDNEKNSLFSKDYILKMKLAYFGKTSIIFASKIGLSNEFIKAV